jgi:hypothetical protein
MKAKLFGLIALPLLAINLPAHATTYTYTGNDYTIIQDAPVPSGTYDKTMSITGSFTVAVPLAASLPNTDISASVQSFSFFDGRNTITQLNASFDVFQVRTDGAGALSTWQIQLLTPNTKVNGSQFFQIFVQNNGGGGVDIGYTNQCDTSVSADCTVFFGDQATSLQPGTFSATPLPAALPLFASGLGAMGLLGWRRKKKAQAVAA